MSTLQVLNTVKNQSRKSNMLNNPGSIGNGLLSTAAGSQLQLEDSDNCSNLSGSIKRLDEDGLRSKVSPRGYKFYGKTQYNDMFN